MTGKRMQYFEERDCSELVRSGLHSNPDKRGPGEEMAGIMDWRQQCVSVWKGTISSSPGRETGDNVGGREKASCTGL